MDRRLRERIAYRPPGGTYSSISSIDGEDVENATDLGDASSLTSDSSLPYNGPRSTRHREIKSTAAELLHSSPYSPYAIPRQASHLCGLCRKIFASWSRVLESRSQVFNHHSTLVDMMSSAEKGCKLCAQFCQDSLNKPHPVNFEWKTSLRLGTSLGLVTVSCLSSELCQLAWNYWGGSSNRVNSVTVVRADNHADANIKLSLSSEVDCVPKYATLSHCWGNQHFTTLTTKNFNAFRQSISLNELPKTFKDAIFIAHELGFQYIWIDSLCIIQDDMNDWDTESSRMSDIYGNSSINIAASSAVDGSAGLFFDRHAALKSYVQTDDTVFYDCIPGLFNAILEDSPLSARGWALQERVLPRRTLHFTSREIFWECDGFIACETFPDGIPSSAPFVEIQKRPMDRATWKGLVEKYSRCKLTLEKDKLVAISDLARLVSEINGEYVAGMWREELELQLCWYAPRIGTAPQHYIAPSWSWASINGSIELDELYLEPSGALCVKIIDVQVNPASTFNLYGEVRAATLRLGCSYIMEGAIVYDSYTGSSADTKMKLGSAIDIYAFVRLDRLQPKHGQEVQAYFVAVHITNSLDNITGLLLSPIANAKGLYNRLGVFKTPHRRFLETITSYSQLPTTHASAEKYVDITIDESGTKTYIIDIV
ncbi:hypothetical protein EG329_010840 [Mollisiaceae sp. DMI_Dod_QoI]|nr:hypothetical protein EG329_010840 [Helotiales sp. DMI_Dod_QoI]